MRSGSLPADMAAEVRVNRIQDTIVNMISETIQMADEMTHQHQIESTYAIDAGLRQMAQMHSERAKVCARCTGSHGCISSNCTNACFRCAAEKGLMQLPPKPRDYPNAQPQAEHTITARCFIGCGMTVIGHP